VILIAFDGSPDAEAAIKATGDLLSGERATVLTVWEPFAEVIARTGAGLSYGGSPADVVKFDQSAEENAQKRAEQGVELAKRSGLDAEPRIRARETSVAEAILAEAEEVGANAIVVGTRGLTGLKSLFLGSVSHAVVQHADRPVIVVPSSETASARAAQR
jgi:nucleotide-binding universal stress UspA family protein